MYRRDEIYLLLFSFSKFRWVLYGIMQIMSNGIFRSPMHRVVTNTERLRISVALFHEPEPEREIGPVDSLVDEQRARLYRNVKNYGFINYECYQKGIVALDTVKI